MILNGGFKKLEKDIKDFVGEGKKISDSEFHRMNNGKVVNRKNYYINKYEERGNHGSNTPTKI